MSEKLREAAQQALEALKHSGAANMRYGMEAIVALEAALSEDSSRPAQPVQKPLTIERLHDALVASRIIQPAAVEDPRYDDWVTLSRIEALHRRLT